MGLGMLFAGALTGGAQAAGQIADEQIKRNERAEVRQQSLMDRRNELLHEMEIKSRYAAQEEERVANISNKIAERGQQIGNERGAKELESARSMVPNEGPYANTPVSPADLASMPPAARAIYEKQMGLTDDSPLQAAKDQITATTEIGAPASVKKGLLETYREEAKAAKDSKTMEFNEKKLESQERMRMESEDRKDARQAERLEALIEKANAKGGSKEGAREVLSFLGESRKAITSEESNLRNALKAELKGAEFDPEERKKIQAEYAPKLKELEQKRTELERDFGYVRERLGMGPAPATTTTAPAAPSSSSVTPGSKPAWQSQESYSDQLRALQEELAKAERDGKAADASALRREITRIGGSPGVDAKPSSTTGQPVKVMDKAAYDALPKGAKYVAPDGTTRTKG